MISNITPALHHIHNLPLYRPDTLLPTSSTHKHPSSRLPRRGPGGRGGGAGVYSYVPSNPSHGFLCYPTPILPSQPLPRGWYPTPPSHSPLPCGCGWYPTHVLYLKQMWLVPHPCALSETNVVGTHPCALSETNVVGTHPLCLIPKHCGLLPHPCA
jgi:hypothetical protein